MGNEDNKIRELLKNMTNRADSQDKEITKLVSLLAQADNRTTDLENKMGEARKVDNAHEKKAESIEKDVNYLQEKLDKQAREDENLGRLLAELRENLSQQSDKQNNKNNSVDAALINLKNKDTQLQKDLLANQQQFKKDLDVLRGEADANLKGLYQEFQTKSKQISERAQENHAILAGLKLEVQKNDAKFQDHLKRVEANITSVEKRAIQMDTDFRLAATQTRRNMLELGNKMLNLFQKGIFVGTIDPKSEVEPQPAPEDKPVKEHIVEKKEIVKEVIKTSVKIVVDHKALGSLCYKIAEVYTLHGKNQLALEFANLALQSYRKEAQKIQADPEIKPVEREKLVNDVTNARQQIRVLSTKTMASA